MSPTKPESHDECIKDGHEFPADDDGVYRCIRCNEHPLETLRKYEQKDNK